MLCRIRGPNLILWVDPMPEFLAQKVIFIELIRHLSFDSQVTLISFPGCGIIQFYSVFGM